MNNWQFVLALCVPTVIPTAAVFIAALLPNSRISDVHSRLNDLREDFKEVRVDLKEVIKRLDEIEKRRLVH
jgi:tetrahydromethanopterin S-methyltransferase subunit G